MLAGFAFTVFPKYFREKAAQHDHARDIRHQITTRLISKWDVGRVRFYMKLLSATLFSNKPGRPTVWHPGSSGRPCASSRQSWQARNVTGLLGRARVSPPALNKRALSDLTQLTDFFVALINEHARRREATVC